MAVCRRQARFLGRLRVATVHSPVGGVWMMASSSASDTSCDSVNELTRNYTTPLNDNPQVPQKHRNPRHLHRKYHSRGVLEEEQVIRCARPFGADGRVASTALLFGQTEVFLQPIPIFRARELCERMGVSGFFVTTRETNETEVLGFYEEGTEYRDRL